MPRRTIDGHRGVGGEPPAAVEITVFQAPRGPTVRARIARIAGSRALRSGRVIIGVGVAIVVAVAIAGFVTDAISGGGGGSAQTGGAQARAPGAAGVAAAYGYPLYCLRITIALDDPTFARADFDHAVQCGRYTGYPTAIFHRSRGIWVPVLDAIAYVCPVRSLPLGVQVELAVCP
jgi:hypothetical protein